MSLKRPTSTLFYWLLGALGAIVVFALVVPWISPYDPAARSDLQFSPPSMQHWGGTDLHGRDVLTRVASGMRITLLVGIIGATISLVIGVTLGAIAGYFGGWMDNLLMRLVDTLYSLPRLIFVILIITLLDKPTSHLLHQLNLDQLIPHVRIILLFVGLGCVEWLTMARIVRGQVLLIKELQFIQAARALGQNHFTILRRHILSQVQGIILIYLTLTIPTVMLEESFLSFLGLGVEPPGASLGTLLSEGAAMINPVQMNTWLLLIPALALAITLCTINFLGDTLRDEFDPKSKARSLDRR
jgi:peptide/nickel transport system permease protein/oligopeptide transport system permease protein